MSLSVDLEGWARAKKVYEGRFLLAEMERLKPYLHQAWILKDEYVSGTLEFDIDSEGWSVVKGEIDGELVLTCQRCLQGVKHRVAHHFKLCLVPNYNKSTRIPELYEPLILSEFSGKIVDLIEDELVLHVPIVMFHVWDECLLTPDAKRILSDVQKSKKNPFTVLKLNGEINGCSKR